MERRGNAIRRVTIEFIRENKNKDIRFFIYLIALPFITDILDGHEVVIPLYILFPVMFGLCATSALFEWKLNRIHIFSDYEKI
ncbi:MAG: hypothetical protein LBF17_05940 [Mediterranea sp.]|jgi:hypothetical protein|nr:hypothetical protein [Mediterranea sp.]